MKVNQKNAEQIEKLLQQIKRQFVSSNIRPPDAAANAMGRELSRHFVHYMTSLFEDKQTIREKVFQCLCQENLHPSIPPAFFRVLLAAYRDTDRDDWSLDWLAQWALRIEEIVREQSICCETLAASIRSYAIYLSRAKDLDSQEFLDTYRRLQLASSRTLLIRETIQGVFSENVVRFRDVLSPLMAVCVLDLKTEKSERLSCLQHLWRASSKAVSSEDAETVFDVLQWMTQALDMFLLGIPCLSQAEDQIAALELAQSWLMELVSMAEALWRTDGDDDEGLQTCLTTWLKEILRDSLPRLAYAVQNHRMVLQPILEALQDMAEKNSALSMDALLSLRLSTLLLSSTPDDCHAILSILSSTAHSSIHSRAMTDALASVFAHDEDCSEIAAVLQKQATVVDSTTIVAGEEELYHLITLLDDDNNALIDTIVDKCDFKTRDLSVVQQVAALLFGMALLGDSRRCDSAYPYLKNLVGAYSHLGIHLVPVFTDRLNKASLEEDGKGVLRQLDFLCDALVADPSCARQIWNLVGVDLMEADVPLTVRVAQIRLFPKLCASNRRLYRRIIDTLGVCLADKNPEPRLAVAATIADLAKEDLIRDVSDVIGWIQNLLTETIESPIQALLVHYAVMSSHYLVVSDELDFDVVMKVLNKRLCAITDIDAILQLPPVVLEALVLLLGDGECGESEEEEEDKNETTPVSPQVSRAVQALIEIGSRLTKKSKAGDSANDEKIAAMVDRVRQNIYRSLSGYSFEALGIDDEGIRGAAVSLDEGSDQSTLTKATTQYMSLRNLIVDGIDCSIVSGKQESEDAFTVLSRKLLHFEQEALGVNLWEKQGRRQTTSAAGFLSRSILNALPAASEIREIRNNNPCPAGAIALLLSSDGVNLQELRDNGDASLEITDPLFLVFTLQGFLHSAARLLSNKKHSVGQILRELRDWYEVFVSPDVMYLAVSSLSVYIPHTLIKEETIDKTYVDEIYDMVFNAFREHRFQKGDVSKICLGLIGASSIRKGTFSQVDEIITILEQSVRGYGGQQGFGAYYGLGLICQSLPEQCKAGGAAKTSSEVGQRICRIVSFLVEELSSCLEDAGKNVESFVACIKHGKIEKDLVDALAGMQANSIAILMTKHVTARALLVSCALCLPTLEVVQGHLLLASLHLLEILEWGCGKGICLPPVLDACYAAKLIKPEELELTYKEYASIFDSRMDNEEADIGSDGLDDLFYAVSATSSNPTPHIVRRLIVGSKELFDDDGSAFSLIASVAKISHVPCLGSGSFTVPAKLETTAALGDVQSIVEIVSDAARAADAGKYSSAGIIMLGYLASLKLPQNISAVTESRQAERQRRSAESEQTKESDGLDIAKLPSPRAGTLLSGIMDAIAQVCEEEPTNTGRKYVVLRRTMGSLESLSLPKQFVKFFLQPLLSDLDDTTKIAWVSLLMSQIRRRRKAAFDGREFIDLAYQLSVSPAWEWRSLLGRGKASHLFVQNLGFAVKSPHFSVDESIVNLWRNCLADESHRSDMIIALLSAISGLVSSSALSPKVTNGLRRFVLDQVSKDLRDMSLVIRADTASLSVLDAYILCLKELPLHLLDEFKVFNFDDKSGFEGIFSVVCTLELIRQDFFEAFARKSQELLKISNWISKQLPACADENSIDALRRIICLFAELTSKDDRATRSDQLAALFEILFLTPTEGSQLGLEWLSVTMSYWCDWLGSDADLSLGFLCTTTARSVPVSALRRFYGTTLQDLPFNVATFGRREKATSVVFNLLHRLYMRWSAHGVDKSTQKHLRKALISCRSGLPKEEAFVTVASEYLSTKP